MSSVGCEPTGTGVAAETGVIAAWDGTWAADAASSISVMSLAASPRRGTDSRRRRDVCSPAWSQPPAYDPRRSHPCVPRGETLASALQGDCTSGVDDETTSLGPVSGAADTASGG